MIKRSFFVSLTRQYRYVFFVHYQCNIGPVISLRDTFSLESLKNRSSYSGRVFFLSRGFRSRVHTKNVHLEKVEIFGQGCQVFEYYIS